MISYQVEGFGAPLARFEQDVPRPEGTQVLLRVLAAGVCHTDIHTWQGWYDMGGGHRMSVADRGVSLPLTMGHEIVGEVIAAGPQAPQAVPGQRRLVYPWIGCGECKVCSRGSEQVCPSPRYLGIFRAGGYSDHVVVPHPRHLVDIGDMPAAQAAPYACSGLTVYSALRKIDPAVLAEERIVIFGAGGLGLMAVTLLRALNGAGAVVVETVQAALDMLVKGGHLVQVGLFGGRIELPTPSMPLRSISYSGSFVGSLPDLQDLMSLVRERAPVAVPTCCRPLHEASAALDDLEHGRVVGRVILEPTAQSDRHVLRCS